MSDRDLLEFPLVDILVPVYNQKHLVSETMDSILVQDYPNIRIIISDDASTDGSQALLQAYYIVIQTKLS